MLPKTVGAWRYGDAKAVVCVEKVQHREPIGKLWGSRLAQAIPFHGVLGMIGQMEKWLAFPQNYCQPRSFLERAAEENAPAQQEKDEVIMPMGEEVFETKVGEKATFIIQVQFRQNSTWQGTIQWVEEKKTQRFRSTLEMIRLMDEALRASEDTAAPPGSVAGWGEIAPQPHGDCLKVGE